LLSPSQPSDRQIYIRDAAGKGTVNVHDRIHTAVRSIILRGTSFLPPPLLSKGRTRNMMFNAVMPSHTAGGGEWIIINSAVEHPATIHDVILFVALLRLLRRPMPRSPSSTPMVSPSLSTTTNTIEVPCDNHTRDWILKEVRHATRAQQNSP